MRRKRTAAAFTLLALLPALAWAEETRWLHIRVQENGERGEKVSINLPLDLVEAVLPLIEEEEISGGKVKIDSEELTSEKIRKILQALREAEEGEYVRVEEMDEDVRIAKEGDYLMVRAREDLQRESGPDRAEVRIHLSVLEALLSSEVEGELDLLAAIEALGEKGEGELIVVNDEESTVEIWVDKKSEGK